MESKEEKENRKKIKIQKEEQRLEKLKEVENKLYSLGYKKVCGIDEVGRGPLAGPVVVASVIMKPESKLQYVNDSKKVTKLRREKLIDQIKEDSISWGIGVIWQEEIDEINILNATKKALTQSIEQLDVMPDHILVDALTNIDTLGIPYSSIIKGDEQVYAISCASIVAKVTRDKMMDEFAKVYPQYGFEKNKGYGTKEHIEAIKKYGICPLHRITYCKNFLNG